MDTVSDNQSQFDVIIPTMGSKDLIVECVDRILQTTTNSRFRLVVVCNPNEGLKGEAIESHSAVEAACATYNEQGSNGVIHQSVELIWKHLDGPAGWVGAVNIGVAELSALSDFVIIMNDDVIVTNNWYAKLGSALKTDRIWYESKLAAADTYYDGPGDDVGSYGRVGAAGPLSTFVAGAQAMPVGSIEGRAEEFYGYAAHKLLDDFSAEWEKGKTGRVLNTDFLSGFCTAYTRECLLDLMESNEDGPFFLDPRFGIGGYDDDDIAARMNRGGWRQVIASDCYVHHKGHQTLDVHFKEIDRGLMNVSTFVEKWSSERSADQKVIGCMRVKLSTLHDVAMFYDCVGRNSLVLDGLSVLLTNNPYEIVTSEGWNGNALTPETQVMVGRCGKTEDTAEISAAVKEWLEGAVAVHQHAVPITVDVWAGEFNERDERNKTIEMAEAMGADWIFSIDHDEFLEDRVDRKLFRRLIAHPDPNVRAYDFGWLNHWDTPRVFRTDAPWGQGYTSSMHGIRLWKVTKGSESPLRITGGRADGGNDVGLHCGNAPEICLPSRRVAGIRFRHFGYLRHTDRVRKHQFYTTIDPTPDAVLTGGGYGHLISEENMQLTPYIAANGIVFSMLVYKEEQLPGLYRLLNHAYALVDDIALVWTGPEGTEPPDSMKTVARLFGAEWTYKPFDDDLSAVRNAGIQHLREKENPRVRWFLTMDDDEHWAHEHLNAISIRRMAECTNTWAWMFRFRNWRKDKTFNYSETLRMFVMDPQGLMKFSGRVHESIEESIHHLKEMGVHPEVRFAPFETDHTGLGGDATDMQGKLEFYTRLLEKQIRDTPLDTGSWCSLGLQFMNDGMTDEAKACFENSVVVAGESYLGYRELGNVYLRLAKLFIGAAHDRLAPAHPLNAVLEEQIKWLGDICPPFPVNGSALEGKPIPTKVNLNELQTIFTKALEDAEANLSQEDPQPGDSIAT